jgi:hypothetical protein
MTTPQLYSSSRFGRQRRLVQSRLPRRRMTSYRCSGCGILNWAINDLSGMAHTRTGGKPSECTGRYQPAETTTRHTPQAAASSPKPDSGGPGVQPLAYWPISSP